jgi:hypothetical protein
MNRQDAKDAKKRGEERIVSSLFPLGVLGVLAVHKIVGG